MVTKMIKSNYSLDDLRCFYMIAKMGSYKKATKHLDMPLSTLSRRIRHLESDLQLRLLNRDAHRVTLTPIGEHYYNRCHIMFNELTNIEQDLQEEKNLPAGKIRVSAPIHSGKTFLSHLFSDFLLKYPEIQLDLRFSNTLIDIEAEGIDVAFRMKNPAIDNWIVRELKLTRNILCCSSLQNLDHIKHPEQLCLYPKVTCFRLLPWQLIERKTGQRCDYQPNDLVRLEVDEIQIMTESVKKGVGISYIPDYLALPMIEKGELKRVLSGWESEEQAFSMLYRDRENIPLRVRLFVDYVLTHFVK